MTNDNQLYHIANHWELETRRPSWRKW